MAPLAIRMKLRRKATQPEMALRPLAVGDLMSGALATAGPSGRSAGAGCYPTLTPPRATRTHRL